MLCSGWTRDPNADESVENIRRRVVEAWPVLCRFSPPLPKHEAGSERQVQWNHATFLQKYRTWTSNKKQEKNEVKRKTFFFFTKGSIFCLQIFTKVSRLQPQAVWYLHKNHRSLNYSFMLWFTNIQRFLTNEAAALMSLWNSLGDGVRSGAAVRKLTPGLYRGCERA